MTDALPTPDKEEEIAMSRCDNPKPRVVLASRKNAGIRVRLLWAEDTNTAAVVVHDDSTDDQFELLVEANPLDVYEHPYAYAAWRGIDYRSTDLRQAA
jgi:hypothetical protein